MKILHLLKNWFFELIEDAVGEETMKKYKNEIEKDGNSNNNF
tara:strand:- start:610 stop:735 length:126 start_codon:yes stop_codon:yes gene_type:complete